MLIWRCFVPETGVAVAPADGPSKIGKKYVLPESDTGVTKAAEETQLQDTELVVADVALTQLLDVEIVPSQPLVGKEGQLSEQGRASEGGRLAGLDPFIDVLRGLGVCLPEEGADEGGCMRWAVKLLAEIEGERRALGVRSQALGALLGHLAGK